MLEGVKYSHPIHKDTAIHGGPIMIGTETDRESNRRTVKALAVVLLVVGAALMSVGTYAYFTDTESSTSNPVQSSTLDLTLDGNNGDVSTSFSLTGAGPTDSVTHTYDIRNTGSLSADHVEISILATENDTGLTEPSDSDLDTELANVSTQEHINVTTYEYQNDSGGVKNNMLSSVSDNNGNGITDLADVINQTSTTDNLIAPQANSGNTTKLVLTVRIANDDGSFTGTDEDIMADGVDIKIDVTLNQDSSQ